MSRIEEFSTFTYSYIVLRGNVNFFNIRFLFAIDYLHVMEAAVAIALFRA